MQGSEGGHSVSLVGSWTMDLGHVGRSGVFEVVGMKHDGTREIMFRGLSESTIWLRVR